MGGSKGIRDNISAGPSSSGRGGGGGGGESLQSGERSFSPYDLLLNSIEVAGGGMRGEGPGSDDNVGSNMMGRELTDELNLPFDFIWNDGPSEYGMSPTDGWPTDFSPSIARDTAAATTVTAAAGGLAGNSATPGAASTALVERLHLVQFTLAAISIGGGGGGGGSNGLRIFDQLRCASSGPCPAFASPCLVPEEPTSPFMVEAIEVFCVPPAPNPLGGPEEGREGGDYTMMSSPGALHATAAQQMQQLSSAIVRYDGTSPSGGSVGNSAGTKAGGSAGANSRSTTAVGILQLRQLGELASPIARLGDDDFDETGHAKSSRGSRDKRK